MQPLFVRVHPADNVAIIVNPGGLEAGSEFTAAPGLRLRERIPQAHKVALVPI
jgi:galactarate dehydratase